MAFSVRGENEPEPEIEGRAWLKLRGWLFEPIRDVHEVTFSLWPDPDKRAGPARPVSVAHIVAVRPTVEVIASFTPADFHYIWSLALSGHLTYAYINFTKPHYGSASVVSLLFSNEFEE